MTAKKRPFSQDFSGPSMTDQSFQNSSNVNTIIRKYVETGIDPMPGASPPNFGFATSKTYSEVAREMAEINSAFATLPSAERARHNNSPAEWLDSIATTPDEVDEIFAPPASDEAPQPPPAEAPPEDSTPGE